MTSTPAPEPKEVMDVDDVLNAHDMEEHSQQEALGCPECHKGYETYAAQQNAALLRSLLERKRVTGQIGENGYRVDTEWIPASILEAKLKTFEEAL